MRKGSLGVTFFTYVHIVRPSVCPQILGKSVRVRPVSVQWSRSGLEVDRKWTGSGPYARDLQAQGACALRFFR